MDTEEAVHNESEEKPKTKAWADEDDEEEQAPVVEYDPKAGIKRVTTYKKNEKGQTVRATAIYKITVQRAVRSPAIDTRKQWKKFGVCAGLPPGPERGITETSPDDFELLLGPQVKQEVKEEKSFNMNVECRLCKKKGDHYTANCPLKDVLLDAISGQKEEDLEKVDPAVPGKELYKVPNRRVGAGGDDRTESSGRDELPTVRVSNLSESAYENDLQELFKPFGAVQRVFIAKDKTTGASRGFGFVTFYHREDAAKAIAKLDGHGYDHLILHLEWALPSKK